MRKKLNYSLAFLLACSSFSSEQFHHSRKMKPSCEINVNVNRKLLFCVCVSKKLPSIFSVWVPFLLWMSPFWFKVWICCIYQLFFHLHLQMFSNLTFHFEHKYSLWLSILTNSNLHSDFYLKNKKWVTNSDTKDNKIVSQNETENKRKTSRYFNTFECCSSCCWIECNTFIVLTFFSWNKRVFISSQICCPVIPNEKDIRPSSRILFTQAIWNTFWLMNPRKPPVCLDLFVCNRTFWRSEAAISFYLQLILCSKAQRTNYLTSC